MQKYSKVKRNVNNFRGSHDQKERSLNIEGKEYLWKKPYLIQCFVLISVNPIICVNGGSMSIF